MDDELRTVARQLLRSRLRHRIFQSMAEGHGADESVWQTMLVLETAIRESAAASWAAAVATSSPSDAELLQTLEEALYLAVTDVSSRLEGQIDRERLTHFTQDFLSAFRTSDLTNIGPDDVPC